MIYENNGKIKLFDEIFINNNKDNCFLLINNKINKIDEEPNLKFNKENNIKIKLIEEKNIENMSFMFYNCNSLLSVDMSKWNINKVKNFDYMFQGCSSLTNLSNISKWDTSNINNMNSMFEDCKKLKTDTTKWNTKNKQITIIYDNIINIKKL